MVTAVQARLGAIVRVEPRVSLMAEVGLRRDTWLRHLVSTMNRPQRPGCRPAARSYA